MSAPFNQGEIKINKPIVPKAKEIIIRCLDICEKDIGYDRIYIDFQQYDLENDIEKMINELRPFRYLLNGSISYFGDSEGRIDITDNIVEVIPIEEYALHDATDEDLIRILEGRGYVVNKKEEMS